MNSIAEIIKNKIELKRKNEIRSNDKFRVSDAGRCHLMRFWKRQGKPFTNEIDERTYRVFEVGHVFHRWLQDCIEEYCNSNKLQFEKEREVEDEHRIGHIDALVNEDNEYTLYEFKTVHSHKFHYNKKNGDGDMHYQMQAFTYAMILPFVVKNVKLIYISKDDLCIDEITVKKSIFEKVDKDWETLIGAWEKNKEPIANPMVWECKYCLYQSECQKKKGGKLNENI